MLHDVDENVLEFPPALFSLEDHVDLHRWMKKMRSKMSDELLVIPPFLRRQAKRKLPLDFWGRDGKPFRKPEPFANAILVESRPANEAEILQFRRKKPKPKDPLEGG